MSPQHDVEATVTLVAEHEADVVVAARTVDEPRARVVDVTVESLAWNTAAAHVKMLGVAWFIDASIYRDTFTAIFFFLFHFV